MRKSFFISVLIISIFGVLSCGGEAKKDNAESQSEVLADEFTIAWDVQPPSLDPLATTATATRKLAQNFYEPLVTLDANGDIQPVLADDFFISDDATEITFNLRQDVPFHDGSIMETKDVIASLEDWKERSSVGSEFLADAVVESPEEGVVVVELEEPMIVALELLANQAQLPVIRPAEVIDAATDDGVQEHIGTGPYELEEWQPDQFMRLEIFEDYQSPSGTTSGTAGEKNPVFKTIQYQFVADSSTRLTGLNTGEYDAANSIPYDNADVIDNDDQLDLKISLDGYNYTVFNKAEGMMADRNMRQAIVAALDPDDVLLAAFADSEFYFPSPALMPENSTWHADSSPEFFERWENTNQDEVDEYLEAAGYEGETLRLMTTREYEGHYNMSVVLTEQLIDAGINVEMQVTDWATVVQNREDPEAWDMFMSGGTWTVVPVAYPYLSPTWAGWTDDAAIQSAIDEFLSAQDEEGAIAASQTLQHSYDEYMPVLQIGDNASLTGVNAEYDGYESTIESGDIFYNIHPVE